MDGKCIVATVRNYKAHGEASSTKPSSAAEDETARRQLLATFRGRESTEPQEEESRQDIAFGRPARQLDDWILSRLRELKDACEEKEDEEEGGGPAWDPQIPLEWRKEMNRTSAQKAFGSESWFAPGAAHSCSPFSPLRRP